MFFGIVREIKLFSPFFHICVNIMSLCVLESQYVYMKLSLSPSFEQCNWNIIVFVKCRMHRAMYTGVLSNISGLLLWTPGIVSMLPRTSSLLINSFSLVSMSLKPLDFSTNIFSTCFIVMTSFSSLPSETFASLLFFLHNVL